MGPQHERYKNPPVVHVLAVVHLNPVDEIEEYINEVTRSLRALGYLDRIESEDLNLNINFLEWRTAEDGSTSPKLNVTKRKAWVFIHRSKEYSLTVSEDKLAFQCSKYEHFAVFEERFVEAVRAVAAEVGNNYVEVRRIGLRYVNLFSLEDGKDSSFWVSEKLLGSGLDGITDLHHHTLVERLYETTPGHVAIRFSDLQGQPALPLGLNPLGLSIPPAIAEVLPGTRRFALLDLDRFSQVTEDFSSDTVFERFRSFNHSLQEFFNVCTTERAKEFWRTAK